MGGVGDEVVGRFVGEGEKMREDLSVLFVDKGVVGSLMENDFELLVCDVGLLGVFDGDKVVCEFG